MNIEEQARRVKELDMEKYLDAKIRDTLGGRDFLVRHFNKSITVVSSHKLSNLILSIIDMISEKIEDEDDFQLFVWHPIGSQRQEILDVLEALNIEGYAVRSHNDRFSKKMGRIVAKLRYLRQYSPFNVEETIDTLYNRITTERNNETNMNDYEAFMPSVANSGTHGIKEEIKRIKIRNIMVSKD